MTKKPRKTLGVSPLEEVIPEATREKTQARTRKVRLTVQVDPETLERVRRAAYWTPGETIAWFVERAVNQAIDETERVRGGPFPDRKGPVRLGRPVR